MNSKAPTRPAQLQILLVEDETLLAEQLSHFLTKRGFLVSITRCINETRDRLKTQSFDLLLLDRLLPDGDSLASLDEFKQFHPGVIIILSALGLRQNRIEGYHAGADIYLSKPVDLDELLAILDSVSQRITQTDIAHRYWTIHHHELRSPQGVHIPLSSREALIIQQLIDNAPNPVKKAHIVESIGADYNTYDTRSLDTTLYRIRNKIKQATSESVPILTYHGVGYGWKES
ncbi:response regulator transcription factor [Thiomicrospira microaerophila]|uniref:response regulator transcription factor n=1 Tax=Thiomicrospira microaerophila TaxID=406020 RepID=UPI0005CAF2A0|nr:response regulator transcription factor [Thiomicrospira microaerophila]